MGAEADLEQHSDRVPSTVQMRMEDIEGKTKKKKKNPLVIYSPIHW